MKPQRSISFVLSVHTRSRNSQKNYGDEPTTMQCASFGGLPYWVQTLCLTASLCHCCPRAFTCSIGDLPALPFVYHHLARQEKVLLQGFGASSSLRIGLNAPTASPRCCRSRHASTAV